MRKIYLLSRSNYLLLSFLLFIIAPFCYSESKQSDSLDRLSAIVNNEIITEREITQHMRLFAEQLNEMGTPLPRPNVFRTQVLENIILEKIQLQLAKQVDIVVDKNIVQENIRNIAAQNQLSLKEFEKILNEKKITFEQFQMKLKNDLIISRLQQQEIGPKIHVSQAEIDAFLNKGRTQNHSLSKSLAEIQVRHILLKPRPSKSDADLEETLKGLREKIIKGTDFAEIARLQSEEPESAYKGGDLGWINEKMVLPEFYQYILSLKPQELSRPFKTELGWHLIQVTGKRALQELPALRRQEALATLQQQKYEIAIKEWLKKIREEADIIIYPTNDSFSKLKM